MSQLLLTLCVLQTNAVPKTEIPPSVVAALKNVEHQFDIALLQDCAQERCFPKGCTYLDHVVVDKPRAVSLPGFGETQGPGSVAPQEYLTQARCEFTHEKSLSAKDIQALTKRVEQKLSKGWLVVTVLSQPLEPVSAELREPPLPKPEAPVPEPAPAVEPAPPPEPAWEWQTALRELWQELLPHFFWMIGLGLTTFAAFILIWALRRLGQETLEEKAMAAQLLNAPPTQEVVAEPVASLPEEVAPAPQEAALSETDERFVASQLVEWKTRIAAANLSKDDSIIVDLMRDWLKSGEYGLLAKAIFTFSDKLQLAFPEDGELATHKIQFAEFLRGVDEQRLPSDPEFFRKLNHHSISSSLLAQADADVYRSLREEFGATGIAGLIDGLAPRHGALLFALSPADCQQETARILSPRLRTQVADQLLRSNRMSKDEIMLVFDAVRAARSGKPLPAVRDSAGVPDRGREFDAAAALSLLLPHIEEIDRSKLFQDSLKRASGNFPIWYENIVFPDMVLRVPKELQADMLLDVDIRSLAAWYSMQSLTWQETFRAALPQSMLNALRGSLVFGSRSEQLALAHRGRRELASALQKLTARGKLTLAEVLV